MFTFYFIFILFWDGKVLFLDARQRREILCDHPWWAGGQQVCPGHNFVILSRNDLVCMCIAIKCSAVPKNSLTRFKVTVQGQMWENSLSSH